MKFVKDYVLFCEGLFSLESPLEIAMSIYKTLILRLKIYEIKKTDDYFVVHSVKLDNNPGVYNIISKPDLLKLEYYRDGIFKFSQEIDCTSSLRLNIFELIKKRYVSSYK